MAFLHASQTNRSSNSWPDPELSIGQECKKHGSLRCWVITGPALEAFRTVSESIQDLLNKHRETLEQGEPKPRAICFDMWMVGPKQSCAQPTIIITSKSKRQRIVAKMLIKDSEILQTFPGMHVKTLGERPAVQRAGPGIAEYDDISSRPSENSIYMLDGFERPCGASIMYDNFNLATLGGLVFIDDTPYGISAQHAQYSHTQEEDSSFNDIEALPFDTDEEDSPLDEFELMDITSRGKLEAVMLLKPTNHLNWKRQRVRVR